RQARGHARRPRTGRGRAARGERRLLGGGRGSGRPAAAVAPLRHRPPARRATGLLGGCVAARAGTDSRSRRQAGGEPVTLLDEHRERARREAAQRNGRVKSARPAAPADVGISVIKIIPSAPPVLTEAAYLGLVGDFLRAVDSYTEATDAGVLAHLLPAVGT